MQVEQSQFGFDGIWYSIFKTRGQLQ